MRFWNFIALCIAVLLGITGCEKMEPAQSPRPVVQPTAVSTRSDVAVTASSNQAVDSPAPKRASTAPNPRTRPEYAEHTTQFFEAAEKGRISLMMEFLDHGANVNDKDDDGQTALHKAVAAGHRSAVVALLARGADMGEKDAQGRTPLMVAAENGHVQLVLVLINPDTVRDLSGEALTLVGVEVGKKLDHQEFIHRLRQLVGTSIDIADQTGQTPFIRAAAKGRLDVIKALANRADPTRRDRQGKTALMLAAAAGDVEMVEYLTSLSQITIKHIQVADAEGKTALDLATAAGHKEVVPVLRQATLVKAAGAGQMALVRSMFESTDFPQLNAAEALRAAAVTGSTPVVRYFMEKWKEKPIEERQWLVGFPVSGFDGTPLAYASLGGHVETVEALLDSAWWGDKEAMLDYITTRIYGNTTVQGLPVLNPEITAFLKATREAVDAEIKK